MFSFYKVVESLKRLEEEMSGGIEGAGGSSSGVSASGAINPPESPSKKEKPMSLPAKPYASSIRSIGSPIKP